MIYKNKIGSIMENKNNLSRANINKSLIKLSLPLMVTALVHLAYNFVDILYLARLRTEHASESEASGILMDLWIRKLHLLLVLYLIY